MSKFKVGDKVRLTGDGWNCLVGVHSPHAGLEVVICKEGYDKPKFEYQGSHWYINPTLGFDAEVIEPKRTLAEKRADDAAVLAHATEKLEATLANGGRDYYGGTTVQQFIEDTGLGFSLGNAVKYISRSGKKSAETKKADLLKAIDYINWEIGQLDNE